MRRSISSSFFGFVVSTFAIACSSSSATSGASGKTCATATDCDSNQECLFPIGSCSAQAVCVDRPGGAQCNSVELLCSCDGSTVTSGCGFPGGYASGPTTGTPSGTSGSCNGDGGVDQ